MIKFRVLATLTKANMDTQSWLTALAQEPPVKGQPIGCKGCPLRPGGEWEENAKKTAPLKAMAGRWGCHASNRPCAGVIRLAEASP